MECHEFDIQILPGGQIRINIHGVKGPGCKEYAKMFEKIMNTTGETEITSEYYEPPTGIEIHIEQSAGDNR